MQNELRNMIYNQFKNPHERTGPDDSTESTPIKSELNAITRCSILIYGIFSEYDS